MNLDEKNKKLSEVDKLDTIILAFNDIDYELLIISPELQPLLKEAQIILQKINDTAKNL